MVSLHDYSLAVSMLSSEPWRSRLSTIFGIAVGLLALSVVVAVVQRLTRGEVASSIKGCAGISFLAAGALLILGLQYGILESYVSWLQRPSLSELFPWAGSSQSADAAEPILRPAKSPSGDLRVSVVSATPMPTPAPSRSSSRAIRPSRRAVMVTLRMENLSKAKKVDFHPWSTGLADSAKDRAVLSDDRGNRYYCLGRVHKDVEVEAASLSPGQSVTDTLTFRPLLAPAEEFTLYLPARNFGEDGTITIQIPKGVIVLDPSDFPKEEPVVPELPMVADASQRSAVPEPEAPPSERSEVAQASAGRPTGYPPPGEGDIYSVGQTFGLGTWEYRVSACQWNDAFADPTGRTIRPAAGHRFLTVVLTAQNVSADTSLLPHVQLADDEGLCYEPCYKSQGDADGLAVGSQEFIIREFTFQVPATKTYSLLLPDGWLATRTAAVRIDSDRSTTQMDAGKKNSTGR